MSLFHPDEFERAAQIPDEWAVDYYRPSDICWKCAKPLTDDFLVCEQGFSGSPFKVNWAEGPEIWLHVDCAHGLALELLEDYLKFQHIRARKKFQKEFGFDPLDEEQ
jgi:hypothetical protein